MAAFSPTSTTVKVRRDGQIVLQGDSGTDTFTIAYEGDGDFSYSQPKPDRVVIRDRGIIVGSRKGDDQPITGSFTVDFRAWTDSASGKASLIDFMDGTGGASSVTKADVAHEEHNLDMVVTIEGSDHTETTDHTATFSSCIFTYDFSEGDPDRLSVSFECYGGVVYTGEPAP